jgi:hypothetical protein
VFRLTLPRTVGAELAGSPLPLAPDESDGSTGSLADADGTAALPLGGGANGVGSAVAPSAAGADGPFADRPEAGGPSAGPDEADAADSENAGRDGVDTAGTSASAPGQPRAGSSVR